MRRRILLAIVGVTALAVVVLTVPLIIIVSRREAADSIRELERIGQRTSAGLDVPIKVDDGVDLPKVEPSISISVYLPDGTKVGGKGPDPADEITRRARQLVLHEVAGGNRVVVDPVVVDEKLVAVVRVAEPLAQTDRRVRAELLLLFAVDLVAIAVAFGVGWLVASKLAEPVRLLRDDAVRLGDGDFSLSPRRSGISELDETAMALAETASRLEAIVARERHFSADASHQMRTPLAAMRLTVETELMAPRPDRAAVLEEYLREVDRLDATVATLLAVGRDRPLVRDELDLGALVDDVTARWSGEVSAAGRTLAVDSRGEAPAFVSRPVLDQIIDVLLANAVAHGDGAVSVDVATGAGGVILTVSDEGILGRDTSTMFVRRDPDATGHGLGLHLARALAEAEGGRLVVSRVDPTTFRLLLPSSQVDRQRDA